MADQSPTTASVSSEKMKIPIWVWVVLGVVLVGVVGAVVGVVLSKKKKDKVAPITPPGPPLSVAKWRDCFSDQECIGNNQSDNTARNKKMSCYYSSDIMKLNGQNRFRCMSHADCKHATYLDCNREQDTDACMDRNMNACNQSKGN